MLFHTRAIARNNVDQLVLVTFKLEPRILLAEACSAFSHGIEDRLRIKDLSPR